MKENKIKKSKKKFLIIFFLIWLIITIYIVQVTYAKYLSTFDDSTNIYLSSWCIKVNNIDITSGNTFSEPITPTFNGNEYVSSNVIVPGCEGNFDLTIDSTPVTVPFSYTITITPDLNIPDLTFSGYSLDNGITIIPISDSDGLSITGTVLPNVNITNIKLYLLWNDENNSSLNDIQDTAISLNNTDFSLLTTVLVEQINT